VGFRTNISYATCMYVMGYLHDVFNLWHSSACLFIFMPQTRVISEWFSLHLFKYLFMPRSVIRCVLSSVSISSVLRGVTRCRHGILYTVWWVLWNECYFGISKLSVTYHMMNCVVADVTSTWGRDSKTFAVRKPCFDGEVGGRRWHRTE